MQTWVKWLEDSIQLWLWQVCLSVVFCRNPQGVHPGHATSTPNLTKVHLPLYQARPYNRNGGNEINQPLPAVPPCKQFSLVMWKLSHDKINPIILPNIRVTRIWLNDTFQDDVVMGTLSVRENFLFSANLRLPSSVTKAEKESRVDAVINELGLPHVANSKVSAGHTAHSQKKQFNLAKRWIDSCHRATNFRGLHGPIVSRFWDRMRIPNYTNKFSIYIFQFSSWKT